MLAFIIPVKHPARSRSYEKVTDLLRDTLRSVEAQTDRRFCTVVVGNQRPAWWEDTPTRRFVDSGFPPAEPPKSQKDWVNWLYLDRGAKLAVAMLHARGMGATHYMPVDADDFVSDRLAGFVAEHPDTAGWYMETGIIWSGLFRIGEERHKFWSYCGTSHVFRADLFARVPDSLGLHPTRDAIVEALGHEYVEKILGNHVHYLRHFEAEGITLQRLPFIGGVWHADTGENSSRAWWQGTRFGPIWGRPMSTEQVREFSIPAGARSLPQTLLLQGWRMRSRVARLVKR